MTKRKTKQPVAVVCHDGKRCKGTHPLICRDHGCGILVGRAAAAESKALATNAERVRSSAWLGVADFRVRQPETRNQRPMPKLQFACGATMEVNDASEMVGKKIVTLTIPAQSHQRPMLDGKPAPCMYGCPARVKASGRKQDRGCFADGSKGWLVKCKIIEVIQNDVATPNDPSSETGSP